MTASAASGASRRYAMALLQKVDDELEARRCLAAAKAARQSPGEWAPAHGIDGRSLNAWRVNLSRRESSSRARPESRRRVARLVELVPAPMASPAPRYVVRIGDASIEFGAEFDETTLRRAIAVLRSC